MLKFYKTFSIYLNNGRNYPILVLFALILTFSACGDDSSDDDVVTVPVELQGTWKNDMGGGYYEIFTFTVNSMTYTLNNFSGLSSFNAGNLTLTEQDNTYPATMGTYPSGYSMTSTIRSGSGTLSSLVGNSFSGLFFLNNVKDEFVMDSRTDSFIKQ